MLGSSRRNRSMPLLYIGISAMPILSVYRGMSAYDGQSPRKSAAVLMWGLSRRNRPVSSFIHFLSQSVGG